MIISKYNTNDLYPYVVRWERSRYQSIAYSYCGNIVADIAVADFQVICDPDILILECNFNKYSNLDQAEQAVENEIKTHNRKIKIENILTEL